ncbi:MAG: universal stress protein [Bacteroidota bacterium]
MRTFDIKKILIPVDFSETSNLAIEHGGFMAELFGANVVLIHVIEDNWQSFSVIDSGVGIKDFSAFASKAEDKLAEVAERLKKDYNVSSKLICTTGNICNEIVKAVKEYDTDLIVMGTHGVSGFEEFFVGSNTYKVVNRAACPVLSVQTHPQRKGFKDILLPIDTSPHTLQKVDYALALAEKYGATIHVLAVLSKGEDTRQFEKKLEQVDKHIEKSGIISTTTRVEGSNQARMTLEHAKKIGADLIVIMTDQEENLSGRFIGPYAQQVVNHSRTAVMSIAPFVKDELLESVHPY